MPNTCLCTSLPDLEVFAQRGRELLERVVREWDERDADALERQRVVLLAAVERAPEKVVLAPEKWCWHLKSGVGT